MAGVLLAWCLCLPAAAQQEHHAPWDYGKGRGPNHWGDLDPSFSECKFGHQQSPINIETAHIADLPSIGFDYQPSWLHIVDNGHTIMVNYEPGSFLLVGQNRYELKQFHFHHPSEETIGGRRYEMEVHFVHTDSKGHTAVLAVLVKEGANNAWLDTLWNNLPKQKEREEARNVSINAADLLPYDRSYYTFSGSLTTPPCTENVTWFVLKHPATASPQEIRRFSAIYRNDARPTQPLHERLVLESK